MAIHGGFVFRAAFSPDGLRIITGSDDSMARVWDVASGALLTTLTGHEDSVNYVAFSPDGRKVITASADKTARIWDASNFALLLIITGHEGEVNSAAFSPDGSRIITASGDNTTRIWDSTTGSPLAVLNNRDSIVNSALFSPDGRSIVTASIDKTARIWDAPDYLDGHDLAFIRAISSRGLNSTLRARFALAAPAQSAPRVTSKGCDAADDTPAQAMTNLAGLAAWTDGALSGDGVCHQRLAEYYGDIEPAPRDRERAFFHHALAARLLEAQGQDEAAQHERYHREAFAWLLPRRRVEQLMDAADDWKPGQAFPQ